MLLRLSALRLAALSCLVLQPAGAMAMAPDYGAITALFYIGGAVALIVWLGGLFVASAIGKLFRGRGRVYGVILYLGATMSGLVWLNHSLKSTEQQRREHAAIAKRAESDFCRTEASEDMVGLRR